MTVEIQLSLSNQKSVPFSLFSNFHHSLFSLHWESVSPILPYSIHFLPSFLSKLSFSSSHLDLSSLFWKPATFLNFPLPFSQHLPFLSSTASSPFCSPKPRSNTDITSGASICHHMNRLPPEQPLEATPKHKELPGQETDASSAIQDGNL